jgi:hypothetical protein
VQLYLLVDVKFLSQLDENSIESVEVVAVVASRGCEVEDDEVIITTAQSFVVVVPLGEEGLLADSPVGLDDERLVILYRKVKVEPLLDHEVILLKRVAGLLLVEFKDGVRGAEWSNMYSM